MIPSAPVSMLSGKGSAIAVVVIAIVVALVLYDRSQQADKAAKTKSPSLRAVG